MLVRIYENDPSNMDKAERFAQQKYAGGENISSVPRPQSIVFSPAVFHIPTEPMDRSLVSVMMPFDGSFNAVYEAIKNAAGRTMLHCLRVDDIWEHSTIIQDIFNLIFRSHIVVCDLTGRNPNVFYEAGIAHTLGKHVVPITQNPDDVPFDLRHHRYIRYLNNKEGHASLDAELQKRFATLSAE